MTAAAVLVSEQRVKEALGIPDALYLAGVEFDPFTHTVRLAIVGEGLPKVIEGSMVRNIGIEDLPR